MAGYIYIRCHEYYDIYNVCKLGKTINLHARDSQYATGEIVRGFFLVAYEVQDSILDDLEIILQIKFMGYHIIYDGGTEFYSKQIIGLIEHILSELNVQYKILRKDDILNIVEEHNKKSIKCTSNICIPYDYQLATISDIIKFYSDPDNTICNILWACGSGKTKLALFLIKYMRVRSVVIGVPTIFYNNR